MERFFQKKDMCFFVVLVMLFGMPASVLGQYKKAEEAKGVPIGTMIKPFAAKTAEGKRFSLKQALDKGPVVLVFYRGQWCPVCNKHLHKLQDSLSLITDKGAQLVAISPEKPELLSRTREKTGATFPLLYDEGYAIANLFDVTFLPPKATRLLYNTAINANLKEAHSDDSERLPIPATFVLDQKGKVVWRQVDPDYKVRASVQDILRNLPE
jgi:peroxiredoxin